MNNPDSMDFLYNSMPEGQWVDMEWAYTTLRAEYGSRFSAPYQMFHRLVKMERIVCRRIKRNNANQIVSEFIRVAAPNKVYAPKLSEIRDMVALMFDYPAGLLVGPSRVSNIAFARAVAFYLCRSYTAHSFAAIGRVFGNRDHSTVLYGVRRIEVFVADPSFREQIGYHHIKVLCERLDIYGNEEKKND